MTRFFEKWSSLSSSTSSSFTGLAASVSDLESHFNKNQRERRASSPMLSSQNAREVPLNRDNGEVFIWWSSRRAIAIGIVITSIARFPAFLQLCFLFDHKFNHIDDEIMRVHITSRLPGECFFLRGNYFQPITCIRAQRDGRKNFLFYFRHSTDDHIHLAIREDGLVPFRRYSLNFWAGARTARSLNK